MMIKSIKEVNVLMDDINAQIADSENITDEKGYQYIAWHDFLKTVREKLEIETYKFVFIGQKGIGKTTTILELFGLTSDMNGKAEELLTTASGGTTTCEVELLKSEKPVTYFEIEPIDTQLLNQYIDDFCSMYDSAENTGENAYLPSEIARSIRNMTGLKKKDIEELQNDCNDNDKFRAEIVRRIDAQNRTKTIIECQNSKGDFFKDCQEKFHEINLCKIKDVMLPKRIKIFLTKDIFDFDKRPYISSIIDTRGIDTDFSSPSAPNKMKREDILDYIDKEQNNCLFFFIDDIKPAPSQNIAELLRSRFSTSSKFHFYLLVNIKGKEAEEVMTDDGKAGTAHTGIEYKKDDILNKFKQLSIHFSESNLLFFNAKENAPTNDTILSCIEKNVGDKKQDLYKLCDDVQTAYNKLKYDFENHPYALQNFDTLKKYVENVAASGNVFDMLLERFTGELRNIHPARLAAMNRYEGEYYAFNFFHEISLVAENLFDDFFNESKRKIIDKVNDFMIFRGVTELDIINYRVFLEKFENDYGKYRNQLKEFIKSEIKKNFQTRTWEQAVAEYGLGRGYRDSVLDIYKNELTRFASMINVRDNYNSRWDAVVKENSLL